MLFAGKPDPVKNCSVGNKTFTSVFIECQPGYDGGIHQQFVLEIFPFTDYAGLQLATQLLNLEIKPVRKIFTCL